MAITSKTLLCAASDMGADILSALFELEGKSKIGIHITAPSATHVGTIFFRLANRSDATPVAMSAPTIAVANGVAVADFVELVDITAAYLQVFYDRTSGDGALTVELAVKE